MGFSKRRLLLLTPLILPLLGLPSPPLSAQEEKASPIFIYHRFVHGQTLHYRFSEEVTLQNPTPVIEFPAHNLQVKSELKYFVSRVMADGSALLKIDVERFGVFRDGIQIADIVSIPGFSGSVNNRIKGSGESFFYRRVFLLLTPEGRIEFHVSDEGDLFKYGDERKRIKSQQRGILDEKSGLVVPPPPTPHQEKSTEGLYSFKVDILPVKLYQLAQLPNTALIKGREKAFSPGRDLLHRVTLLGEREMGLYKAYEILAFFKGVDRETSLHPLPSFKGEVVERLTGDSVSFISMDTGKLLNSGGSLTSEVSIPGRGSQTATATMKLELYK